MRVSERVAGAGPGLWAARTPAAERSAPTAKIARPGDTVRQKIALKNIAKSVAGARTPSEVYTQLFQWLIGHFERLKSALTSAKWTSLVDQPGGPVKGKAQQGRVNNLARRRS